MIILYSNVDGDVDVDADFDGDVDVAMRLGFGTGTSWTEYTMAKVHKYTGEKQQQQ